MVQSAVYPDDQAPLNQINLSPLNHYVDRQELVNIVSI